MTNNGHATLRTRNAKVLILTALAALDKPKGRPGRPRRKGERKRRVTLLLAAMVVTMVMASGVALAANVITCPTIFGTSKCNGTTGADTMNGNEAFDYMLGDAGADTIYGKGGPDKINGGPDADYIYGGPGSDEYLSEYYLWGGDDDAGDHVYGGGGDDRMQGGFAQGGVDHLYGGKGNDFIRSAQRSFPEVLTREVIDCGPGSHDTVLYDAGLDEIHNCEIKHPYY